MKMNSLLAAYVLILTHAVLAQPYLCPAPDVPPWCSDDPTCSSALSVSLDGMLIEGAATVRMGADQIFDKPVILVEGFDFGVGWQDEELGFGKITWSNIHGTDPIGFPSGLEYRPMLDELHLLGADLIFLDFAHGTTSLYAKSALLSEVIALVQNFKVGLQPSILVGVSMGGVVARMALSQWESLGNPHCVGQYYSVDAPHLGATMPVGLQALILGLSTTSETGLALWNALNSSAAHELLKHHISDNGVFVETQAALTALGWPERSLNFNVVNSREDAEAELTDDPLLWIEWGMEWPWSTSMCYVQANRWSTDSEHSASFLLPGSLFDFEGSAPWQFGSLSFAQPLEDPEAAPGSEANHLEELAAALMASIPLSVLTHNVQSQTTFIPYHSALGLEDNSSSPWFGLSTANPANPREAHASLPNHHRSWLLNWMTSLWNNSTSGNWNSPESSITLGWQQPQSRFLHSGTVSGLGQIVVGTSEVPFEVQTSPCEGTVLAEAGGEIHVGFEAGARGVLVVGAGTSIALGPNGVLEIHEGSTVIVEPHGLLQLDGGQLKIHDGGALEVQEHGVVQSSSSSALHLEGLQARWMMEGELNIEEGHSLHVLNLGTMDWREGSSTSILEQGAWDIQQEPSGTWMVQGEVVVHGEGVMHVQGGTLHFTPPGLMVTESWSHWDEVTFEAASDSTIHVLSKPLTTLDACQLGNIHWSHQGEVDSPSLFKLTSNEWSHGRCSVISGQVRFTNNRFDHAFVLADRIDPPSLFVGNQFESTWHESTPSLSIQNTPEAIWLEDNEWQGGNGLHVDNSELVASCNAWEDCQSAVELKGNTTLCMTASCGGGSNRWLNNEVHVLFDEAPLPTLDFGQNLFGPALSAVFSGETSYPYPTWVIQGSSWHIGLLENPWFSPILSNLMNCMEDECSPLPCFAQAIAPEPDCVHSVSALPREKRKLYVKRWNVLGQEVQNFENAVNQAP